jgi:hypothetical protein
MYILKEKIWKNVSIAVFVPTHLSEARDKWNWIQTCTSENDENDERIFLNK